MLTPKKGAFLGSPLHPPPGVRGRFLFVTAFVALSWPLNGAFVAEPERVRGALASGRHGSRSPSAAPIRARSALTASGAMPSGSARLVTT